MNYANPLGKFQYGVKIPQPGFARNWPGWPALPLGTRRCT